jgi:ribosomal protein S1
LYKGKAFEVKRGEYVRCKITKKLDDNSGYFVELVLNPLYSGIVDMAREARNFQIGQEVDLRVFDVDEKRHLKLRAY